MQQLPGITSASVAKYQNSVEYFHGAEQPGNAGSTSDYESAGIRHLLAAETSGDLHARHPYIYASAEDLCVGDIELLLSAYKQMVRPAE